MVVVVAVNPSDPVGAGVFVTGLLIALAAVVGGIVFFFFVVAVVVGGASSVAGTLVVITVVTTLGVGISRLDARGFTLVIPFRLVCGWFWIYQVLIRKRVSGGAPGFEAFQNVRLRTAAYGGTSFKETNMIDANLKRENRLRRFRGHRSDSDQMARSRDP